MSTVGKFNGGRQGRHAWWSISLWNDCLLPEVPAGTDGSGVEGNKMEVVLEVSFELMDGLWSWPMRSPGYTVDLDVQGGTVEKGWRHVQEAY